MQSAEQRFIDALVGLEVVPDTVEGRAGAFMLSIDASHPKFAAVKAAQAAYRMDLRRELGVIEKPDASKPENWLPAIGAKIIVLETSPHTAAEQSLTADLEECVAACRTLGIPLDTLSGIVMVPSKGDVWFPRGTEAARLNCLKIIRDKIETRTKEGQ